METIDDLVRKRLIQAATAAELEHPRPPWKPKSSYKTGRCNPSERLGPAD